MNVIAILNASQAAIQSATQSMNAATPAQSQTGLNDNPDQGISSGMVAVAAISGGFIVTVLVICAISIRNCFRTDENVSTNIPMVPLSTSSSRTGSSRSQTTDTSDLEAQGMSNRL